MEAAAQPVQSPPSEHAPMREPQFLVLALKHLRESPTNPRKTFEGLDELAASIREKGVLQPIGVRHRKGAGELSFEIVFGHRRFRAAALAGLTAIPCLVLELDDRQTIEVQVIENVQRSDVHPLEEADGYVALLKTHGYTIEKLAAKIGRPPAYVRLRVMLASLCDEAREKLTKGKITLGVAQLLARMPSHDSQRGAVKRVTGWYVDACPSVRQVSDFLQREYMLQLEGAPFDRKSKTLLPIAGACTECPKRTGSQPELFADVKTKDSCTDPKCFAQKRDAAAKQKLEDAKASGKKILSASETKKLFPQQHSTYLTHGAPYVDTKDAAYDVDSSGRKNWGQVIKDRGIATVVAVDPVGNVRELIPREELKSILKELGKRSSGATSSLAAEDRERRAKHKLWAASARIAIDGVVTAIEADAGWRTESAALLAIALDSIIAGADHATVTEVVKRRELAPEPDAKQKKKATVKPQRPEELLRAFAAKASIEERVGLGLELLITRDAVPQSWSIRPGYGSHLLSIGKLFGIDVNAIEKEVGRAQREAKKAKAKKAPAKKARR